MPIVFKPFPDAKAIEMLGELFESAYEIDIAVGYFSEGGLNIIRPYLQKFLEQPTHRLRLLASPSMEQTDGSALQYLREISCQECRDPTRWDCVRFFDQEPQGIFHPKAMIFHDAAGDRVLLGSANLTYRAWSANTEWNLLLKEDSATRLLISDVRKYFEACWSRSPVLTDQEILRFVTEQKKNPMRIPEPAVPTWKVGDIVRAKSNPEWGIGEVIRVKPDLVTVEFSTAPQFVPASGLEVALSLTQKFEVARDAKDRPTPEAFAARNAARFLGIVNARTGALSRTRVDVLPHQMLVAHRVVSSEPTRWLVADDVGLGKTIEAGLVARALETQGRAQRILIVVPAGLTRQWQEEMDEKFGISDFVLFRRQSLEDYGIKSQAYWANTPRVIASLDTLKLEHHRLTLEGSRWDLVIFDEAHKLSSDAKGGARENYKLAQFLNEKAQVQAALYLTATPHQGKADKFANLMHLVRSDIFPKNALDKAQRKRLGEAIIRNRKESVTDPKGKPLFKGIAATQNYPVKLSSAELRFLSELYSYLREGYERVGKDSQSRAIGFVMTTFQKLASSSHAAIEAALRTRLQVLEPTPRAPKTRTAKHSDPENIDARTQDENIATDGQLREKSFFKDEAAQIKGLLALLKRASVDSKAEVFKKSLAALLKASQDENILIFTEYRETQDFLVQMLAREYGEDKVACINGGQSLDEKRAAAEDFNFRRAQFLVSTEAGGEGINLQPACHIVFNYDLPWNPMRLHQRIGRVYRYGQKHKVQVFGFRRQGSAKVSVIDDRIQQVLQERIEAIVEEMSVASPAEGASNMREVLLGELAESINFEDLFRQAVLKDDVQQTEQDVKAALAAIKVAQSQFRDLFSNVGDFSMADFKAIEPEADMEDVQRFVETFLASTPNSKGLKRNPDDSTGSTYSLHVPPVLATALEGVKLTGPCKNLTFDKSFALSHKDADLLGFGHPLLEVMLQQSLAKDTSVCLRQVPAEIAAWKGTEGIEFHWIITVSAPQVAGRAQTKSERWISVFVDKTGKHKPNISRELLKLPAGSKSSSPLTWATSQNLQNMKEIAQGEAEKERQKVLSEFAQQWPDAGTPVITLDLWSIGSLRFV